jgi:DNA-3-methyladenine glycosylase
VARPLPRSFFARDADVVARELLGQLLVHDAGERRAARITQTEAYFGPAGRNEHLRSRADMPAALRRRLIAHGDPASHAFRGSTPRSRVMYGPPGVWYVYSIYGLHECANVVTGPPRTHEPQAVLLRAGEPVEGMPADADLGGPARLTKRLGISRRHDGADATRGALRFERGATVEAFDVAPRINVVGGEDLLLRYLARPDRSARKTVKTRKAP